MGPGHPPGPHLSASSPPTPGSLPVWLLLLLCAALIVGSIVLLQMAFPGFL